MRTIRAKNNHLCGRRSCPRGLKILLSRSPRQQLDYDLVLPSPLHCMTRINFFVTDTPKERTVEILRARQTRRQFASMNNTSAMAGTCTSNPPTHTHTHKIGDGLVEETAYAKESVCMFSCHVFGDYPSDEIVCYCVGNWRFNRITDWGKSSI